VLEFWAELCK